ncbi:MAG: hypothetical protein FWH35_09030 [Treponema sp.]|nr:hypothetical protein [Treponema sp.]
MKRIFLGLILLIMTFSLYPQSNEGQKDRRFSIQINPLLFVADFAQLLTMTEDYNISKQSFLIGMEFQYAATNLITLSFEPRFGIGNDLFLFGQGFGYGSNGTLFNEDFVWDDSNVKYTLVSLNPGILFRMLGRSLNGLYLGTYATVGWKNASMRKTLDNPEVNDNFLILGITEGIGYQWVFRRGFTISLGGGFGKTWELASDDNTGQYDKSKKYVVDVVFNFKIGYSF